MLTILGIETKFSHIELIVHFEELLSANKMQYLIDNASAFFGVEVSVRAIIDYDKKRTEVRIVNKKHGQRYGEC